MLARGARLAARPQARGALTLDHRPLLRPSVHGGPGPAHHPLWHTHAAALHGSAAADSPSPAVSAASFSHPLREGAAAAPPPIADTAASLLTSVLDAAASVFEPFSRLAVPQIYHLPHYLHLESHPHGYAISLVLLAFLVRGTVSLPVKIWMRRRVARLTELAVPEWEKIQKDEESHIGIVRRCRKLGMNYEQYKKELEREFLAIRASLLKKYRCTPGLTTWLPPLVNVPIFLALSFAIRQSVLTPDSPLLHELLPWWSAPEHLSQSFEASAAMLRDRGMDPEALQKLSRPMGPTLGDKDATHVAPLAVGLLTFLNLELATKGRETVQEILKLVRAKNGEEVEGNPKIRSIPMEKIKSQEEIAKAESRKSSVNKWAAIGRGLAIGSVPLATQVPGAILIYWLATISYNLLQTTIFNFLDIRRARHRVALLVPHTDQTATTNSSSATSSSKSIQGGKVKMSFAQATREALAKPQRLGQAQGQGPVNRVESSTTTATAVAAAARGNPGERKKSTSRAEPSTPASSSTSSARSKGPARSLPRTR